MIEADVMLDVKKVPIMAHDKEDLKNFTLKQFLDLVAKKKSMGIKLDFKTIEAMEASVSILNATLKDVSIIFQNHIASIRKFFPTPDTSIEH